MNEQVVGASVRRKEDFRFLTGAGNYTDDIHRPGQLYAYILRSPHAHAEIAGIDTARPPPHRASMRSSPALRCRSAACLAAGW
jgi:carbon-monoxide dehydrogenase large subunit